MPQKYNLTFSASARSDLKNIFAYIAADNPQTAEKILDKIEAKANYLVIFPQKGRIVPELLAQNIKNYRELQESPWRIIYLIDAANIVIVSVLDSRRNIQDLLTGKFLDNLPK